MSLEAARGGSGGPAVAEPGALDELAKDDEGGGEEEVEVDDRAGRLNPCARRFRGPPFRRRGAGAGFSPGIFVVGSSRSRPRSSSQTRASSRPISACCSATVARSSSISAAWRTSRSTSSACLSAPTTARSSAMPASLPASRPSVNPLPTHEPKQLRLDYGVDRIVLLE